MTRRTAAEKCPKCNRPMNRVYAKVKPLDGGVATLKATGWMCAEHRHIELDEQTPFEKAWAILKQNKGDE